MEKSDVLYEVMLAAQDAIGGVKCEVNQMALMLLIFNRPYRVCFSVQNPSFYPQDKTGVVQGIHSRFLVVLELKRQSLPLLPIRKPSWLLRSFVNRYNIFERYDFTRGL